MPIKGNWWWSSNSITKKNMINTWKSYLKRTRTNKYQDQLWWFSSLCKGKTMIQSTYRANIDLSKHFPLINWNSISIVKAKTLKGKTSNSLKKEKANKKGKGQKHNNHNNQHQKIDWNIKTLVLMIKLFPVKKRNRTKRNNRNHQRARIVRPLYLKMVKIRKPKTQVERIKHLKKEA